MDRRVEKARNLLQQGPGRESSHTDANFSFQIAQCDRQRHRPGTLHTVSPSAGEPFRVLVAGRDRGALDRLHALGLEIETITEHGGDYPGHIALYVLRSTVTPAFAADLRIARAWGLSIPVARVLAGILYGDGGAQ